MAKTFLRAEWKNLVMLNYEIEPSILEKHVPFGTELDFWEGKTYISLVGFMFLKTKVMGIAIPFHQNFEEVNLRFYIKHKSGNEWRRGVCFIKEIVPKPAIAWVANTLYREPYMALKMANEYKLQHDEQEVMYSWQFQGKQNFVKIRASNEAENLVEGSHEEFIAEHYWGYTYWNDKQTSEYEVKHPTWKVFRAKSWDFSCDIENLYGKEFVSVMKEAPASVFMAKGSEISVGKGSLIH